MASDVELVQAVEGITKQLILLNEQVRTSNLLHAETVEELAGLRRSLEAVGANQLLM